MKDLLGGNVVTDREHSVHSGNTEVTAREPERVLVVWDGRAAYVRRVSLVVEDLTRGEMVYRSDTHLGGPFPTMEKALAYLRTSKRDPEWPALAKAAVSAVARRLQELTTDDVWEELAEEGVRGGDPRAIGPVMDACQAEGIVERTEETVKSRRKECHGRPVRVWHSLVRRKR